MKRAFFVVATVLLSFACSSCEDYQVITPQSTITLHIYRWQSESFDGGGQQNIRQAVFSTVHSTDKEQDSVLLNGIPLGPQNLQPEMVVFAVDGSPNSLILKTGDSVKFESRFIVPTGEIRLSNVRNGDTVDFSNDVTIEWAMSDFKGDRVQLIIKGEEKNPVPGSDIPILNKETKSFYIDSESGRYTFKASELKNYLRTKATFAIRRFVDFSIEREPTTYDFELGSWHELMVVVR